MVAFAVAEAFEGFAEGLIDVSFLSLLDCIDPIVVVDLYAGYSQAVPVRPTPRASTFIGTVRWHFRRSMFVSSVKISVIG